MDYNLPTFQGFLTFFTKTNFTFLHFVAKPFKLQKLMELILKA